MSSLWDCNSVTCSNSVVSISRRSGSDSMPPCGLHRRWHVYSTSYYREIKICPYKHKSDVQVWHSLWWKHDSQELWSCTGFQGSCRREYCYPVSLLLVATIFFTHLFPNYNNQLSSNTAAKKKKKTGSWTRKVQKCFKGPVYKSLKGKLHTL